MQRLTCSRSIPLFVGVVFATLSLTSIPAQARGASRRNAGFVVDRRHMSVTGG